MILRRLAQNLRDENWTAIFIEFVLLVLGVFLGIQVANWNEDRQDRIREQEYLERLGREVAEILPEVRETAESLAHRRALIESLRDYLATGKGLESLDRSHCNAAGRSHIYAATIFYPPTIKELIATGNILLIRDPAIKTAILSFDQAHADRSQLRTDIQIDRWVLARHYPQLINSGLATNWADSSCDFEGMRNDPAFRNDFADNLRRHLAYVASLGEQQLASQLNHELVRQRLPQHVFQAVVTALEHEVEQPLSLEVIVHVHDVRVSQLPQASRLLEPLPTHLSVGAVRRHHHLQRERLVERPVTVEHRPEVPAANVCAHLVAPPAGGAHDLTHLGETGGV